MKAFKKILVPVDFSPHSREAIRAAADLGARYGSALTLLHVFQPVAYTLPEGYVLFSAQQLVDVDYQLEAALANAKKDAESDGARGTVTALLQGLPAAQILDFAERDASDLIVMGTHGRTGIRHALIGSVAERVLRRAPCPVLTVKAAQDAGAPA